MRTLAAIAAALLAFGARAQSAEPPTPPPVAPPAGAPAPAQPPAAPSAVPSAPAPAPAAEAVPAPPKKEQKKEPKGTFVLSPKSTVSITGRAWAAVESVRATGSTTNPTANDVKQRLRVTNDSSYLRVRGEYQLTEGVKAFAQLETQFALDGQAAPFDSGRNTGVGLAGVFGTVMLGRWDSPYKVSTLQLDPYIGTGIAGYYNVFGQEPAGTNDSDDRWNSRLTNGAQYWTPKWNGFQAKAAYAAGESHTDTLKPWVASFNATFEAGPVYLAGAYEFRKDCGNPESQTNPACAGSLLGGAGKDQGLRVGGSYRIAATYTKLGVAWERLKSSSDAAGATPAKDLRRDAWFGSLVQGLGSERHQLNLTAGVAGRATSTNVFADDAHTGARFFTAGYQFNWTKDINLFAFYTRIVNDTNAAYRFGSRGFGVKDGADPQGVGAGMHFLF